jgi:hypothetical protein
VHAGESIIQVSPSTDRRKALLCKGMGIRFHCPNGHKLNVKSFLSGKKAICPKCGVKVIVPAASERAATAAPQTAAAVAVASEEAATGSSVVASPELRLTETVAVATTAVETTQAKPVASPAIDPISESPSAVWYVRTRGGDQQGPLSADAMRRLLAAGGVGIDNLVWRAGWPQWQVASAVFANLSAAAVAPAAVATFAPAVAIAGPAVVAPVAVAMPAATAIQAAPVQPVANVAPYAPVGMPVQSVGVPVQSAGVPVGSPMPMGQPVGMAPAVATADPFAEIGLGAASQSPARRPYVRRQSGSSAVIASILLGVAAVALVIALVIVLSNQQPLPSNSDTQASSPASSTQRDPAAARNDGKASQPAAGTPSSKSKTSSNKEAEEP